jgi:hypothetical protein
VSRSIETETIRPTLRDAVNGCQRIIELVQRSSVKIADFRFRLVMLLCLPQYLPGPYSHLRGAHLRELVTISLLSEMESASYGLLNKRITLAFVLTIARMTSSRYVGSRNWSCGKLTPPKEWLSAVILRLARATLVSVATDSSDGKAPGKYMTVIWSVKTTDTFHESSRRPCCYNARRSLLATYRRCSTATCPWQTLRTDRYASYIEAIHIY